MGSWNSACPRIATTAWLDIQQMPGSCLLFLNTHLDHRSQQARVMAAELIVSRLTELELQVPPGCKRHVGTIITGDFNCWQRDFNGNPNPCFKAFRDAGFRDACSESGQGQCPYESFHGWEPDAVHQGSKQLHGHIDWILWRGSGLQLIDFQVVSACRTASDHFPVVARFRVQSGYENSE